METRDQVRDVLNSLGARTLVFADCKERMANGRQALCISQENVLLAIDKQCLFIEQDEVGEERHFLAHDELQLVGTRTIVEYRPRSRDALQLTGGALCLPPADEPALDVDSRLA